MTTQVTHVIIIFFCQRVNILEQLISSLVLSPYHASLKLSNRREQTERDFKLLVVPSTLDHIM